MVLAERARFSDPLQVERLPGGFPHLPSLQLQQTLRASVCPPCAQSRLTVHPSWVGHACCFSLQAFTGDLTVHSLQAFTGDLTVHSPEAFRGEVLPKGMEQRAEPGRARFAPETPRHFRLNTSCWPTLFMT